MCVVSGRNGRPKTEGTTVSNQPERFDPRQAMTSGEWMAELGHRAQQPQAAKVEPRRSTLAVTDNPAVIAGLWSLAVVLLAVLDLPVAAGFVGALALASTVDAWRGSRKH